MTHCRRPFWIFAASLIVGLGFGRDLELPEKVSGIMSQAGTIEYDGYYPSGDAGRPMADYVKANWADLLDHLEEVPSAGKSKTSAAMLLGRIAEELPPEEYLEFMDKFLDAYQKGGIPTNILSLQFCGSAQKDDFFSVNFEHPRARSIISRAKDLVPEKEADFRKFMDELMSGKLADMYMANEPDDSPLPETLPGIKLRSPFASLFEKAKRLGKIGGGADQRPPKGVAADSDSNAKDAAAVSKGSWRLWAIATALGLLGFAFWKALVRGRTARVAR